LEETKDVSLLNNLHLFVHIRSGCTVNFLTLTTHVTLTLNLKQCALAPR